MNDDFGVVAQAQGSAVGDVDTHEVFALLDEFAKTLLSHVGFHIIGKSHLEERLVLQLAGYGDANGVLVAVGDEQGEMLVRVVAERALLHTGHHEHQGHGHEKHEQQPRLVADEQ